MPKVLPLMVLVLVTVALPLSKRPIAPPERGCEFAQVWLSPLAVQGGICAHAADVPTNDAPTNIAADCSSTLATLRVAFFFDLKCNPQPLAAIVFGAVK